MNVTKRKRLARSFGGDLVVIIVLTITGVFMALPLVYTIVSAFKPFEEIFLFPPRFFVKNPTLNNFRDLFMLSSNLWVPFTRYVFNSLLVSVVGTTGQVIFASMAAYPLAKHNFPGRKVIFNIIITALLFTQSVTFIPQYIIMSKLGMVNSYLAIILPSFGTTLGVFLMKQFMEQMIPISTLESARVDGASEYRIFWKIVMPNVKPAWLTLIIFTFQGIWNNNGGAFIYNESLKLLPSAFVQISSGGIARFGVGMAASVFLLIPPIITFVITQSNVIETMSHAGIKE